ncbi:CatB-related O-acetyltransferase [Halopseudomonas laoshanensis]|uniref:CatB-related O-acetyltransferase n=1 Tax=Halopseudomonas laoshanensis TaxID=2268758 RepID=UPI002482D1A1|nr:CatB-related O-acetyltransferase [Halopseudomonas laoshanensis]
MIQTLKYVLSKVIKKSRLCSVRHSKVDLTAKIESGSSFIGSTIARHSFCGYDCDIFQANIGAFTSIANGVVIGGARHPMEWVGMSPVFYSGRDSVKSKFSEHPLELVPKATIGNDVWIGRSAIILSGVSVGDGAVVGAGSIVTKNVPPYAVVAGNPAKIIRYRFEERIIRELMSIKWWEFTEPHLKELGGCFNDVEKFLSVVQSDSSK